MTNSLLQRLRTAAKRPPRKKKNKKKTAPQQPLTLREAFLRKKNRSKRVRIVIELLLFAAIGYLLIFNVFFQGRYRPNKPDPADSGTGETQTAAENDGSGFITVSYSGLTASEALESKIVSQRAFADQMAALHDAGYVTITQQEILDYYLQGAPLPKKALFLVFEDGILDTSSLAQPSLRKNNYIATLCTYAQNLDDLNSKFATAADIKRLLKSSFWELGTNGYRLAYINVFDRYGNYFGHLNADEFVLVRSYLRRDYNHYLMDFLRDCDRLREETVDAMHTRFEADYAQMRTLYTTSLGSVPALYILMHSNTGAFGNDSLVSAENRDLMTPMFGMNFNRQGSCLNTRESSVYDLTRLQSQSYFSTNHLLMRISDDTGERLPFVIGDEKEAANWYIDRGAAEFRDNRIILTTLPYDTGQMTLHTALLRDFELNVTLEGNKVGCQSVYLRTDRALESGVQVALENNALVIRDLSADSAELYRVDLFEFDGGAVMSRQEHEYEGLQTLYWSIIQYDEDPARVQDAREKLDALNRTYPLSLADGGTPYVPDLDIADRDSRKLRIRMRGARISVWLDGRSVVENLPVSSERRGSIALGAGVWKDADNYSHANLSDDVYDAVFIDPVLTDIDNPDAILYAYQLSGFQKARLALGEAWNKVTAFFLTFF